MDSSIHTRSVALMSYEIDFISVSLNYAHGVEDLLYYPSNRCPSLNHAHGMEEFHQNLVAGIQSLNHARSMK